MSFYHVWRVAQRVIMGLFRDSRSLPALLLVPAITVLLIGYVMRHTDDHLTVALVVTAPEWSGRDASTFVEDALHNEGAATVRAPDRAHAEQMLRDGDAGAYVVIDGAFVTGVLGQSPEAVQIGLRGDNAAENQAAPTTKKSQSSTRPEPRCKTWPRRCASSKPPAPAIAASSAVSASTLPQYQPVML